MHRAFLKYQEEYVKWAGFYFKQTKQNKSLLCFLPNILFSQINILSLAEKQPNGRVLWKRINMLPTNHFKEIIIIFFGTLWNVTDCTWDLVSSGLVLSCPAHSTAPIKNTLCQDKQWPGIWWIFLSRDNEVWLTPIKLNWASTTGLFQRQWEGMAENQNPLYS